VKILTASYNTIMGQATEMSQQKTAWQKRMCMQ